MDDFCYLCNENETGRRIHGIPVCSKCFVEGGLNLTENQEILKEVFESPYMEPKPIPKYSKKRAGNRR